MLVCTWGLAKNMALKWEYSVVSEEGHGINRWYPKYIITRLVEHERRCTTYYASEQKYGIPSLL